MSSLWRECKTTKAVAVLGEAGITRLQSCEGSKHRVAEQCKQMEPVVRPLFTVIVMDGKTIVSAEVPGVAITERPVFYKGSGRIKGSYVRVGETITSFGNSDLLSFCRTPRTRDEIAKFLGKTTYYAMRSFVDPLIDSDKLKMTIPDKPRSRNQRYYSI